MAKFVVSSALKASGDVKWRLCAGGGQVSEAELVEQRRSSHGAGEAFGGLGGVDGEKDERAPSPAR